LKRVNPCALPCQQRLQCLRAGFPQIRVDRAAPYLGVIGKDPGNAPIDRNLMPGEQHASTVGVRALVPTAWVFPAAVETPLL
jgi:hypothetical protein